MTYRTIGEGLLKGAVMTQGSCLTKFPSLPVWMIAQESLKIRDHCTIWKVTKQIG